MENLARLYYLACELKPTLPDRRLLQILPKKWQDLIISGVENGLGSGLTNYSQLANAYKIGAEVGINPTEKEFKSLMCQLLEKEFEKKKETFSLPDRLSFMGKLSRYYEGTGGSDSLKRVPFNATPPPLSKFTSGFPPLDIIAGGKLMTGIVTLLGKPGTGKTTLTQAIALNWPYGPVDFYEPEVGEGLMLNKTNEYNINWDEQDQIPDFLFGNYSPEDILEEYRNNPNPNKLAIFDSLHFVCGVGDSPESRNRYVRAYTAFAEMLKYIKLVIVTTQIRRGDSGDSIESSAGSSFIERTTHILARAKRLANLPNGTAKVSLLATKNRMGPPDLECKFEFDYSKAECVKIIEDDWDADLDY